MKGSDEGDDMFTDDDDGYGDIDQTNLQVSFVLLVFSALASIIMIGAYFCQKSRAPRLLLWLFWSNFLWFAVFLVVYCLKYWDKKEMQHETTCSYLTAFLSFFMNFSMLWPSVICFDLWMNTRDPRWRWDSFTSVERWYVFTVALLSGIAPVAIALHPSKKYCDLTHYTPPSESFGVMIEFALPMLAFIFNCFVILVVRRSLKQEMPFSVRTRRRRQMHNYVLVWMFCWGPYLAHELYYFGQTHNERAHPSDSENKLHHMLFLIRNATLYSTGIFDLLIFGMENAWLKRSLRMVCDSIRLTDLCCMEDVQASYLKNTNDKSVTFDSSVPQTQRAEVSKHYVTRRLSRPEKYKLYQSRPDLDPNRSLESLNPRPSADIANPNSQFMKSVLDSRYIHQGNNLADKSPSSSSSKPHKVKRDNASDIGLTSLQESFEDSFEPGVFSPSPATGSSSAHNNNGSPSPPVAVALSGEAGAGGTVAEPLLRSPPQVKESPYSLLSGSPSSSEILKREMMEAQEFGISPHKRGESLQRLHEEEVLGEAPSDCYDPPLPLPSSSHYHGIESSSSAGGGAAAGDEAAHAVSTGILSPLVWKSGNEVAGQTDAASLCPEVDNSMA